MALSVITSHKPASLGHKISKQTHLFEIPLLDVVNSHSHSACLIRQTVF
jgi:hypothetical protein